MNVTTTVLYNKLPAIAASLSPYARKVVLETILDIEARSKTSMQGPKSGREYPHRGGKMHQASAPGEPPAIDTGNLANSIQTKMIGSVTGIVFTNTEYAPPLEFGSANMAPRPFFLPSAKAAFPDFLAKMRGIISGS